MKSLRKAATVHHAMPKTAARSSLHVNFPIDALLTQPVVLAVSGGSDSMALLQNCIGLEFENLHVVTIDHGLRAAAADEADFVKSVCVARNIPHTTIKVHVEKIGNLQQNARLARYDALIAHCKKLGAKHICLGHTADDQAETFMLRAFRGSGIDGLAGMALSREQDGITFWRPLLHMRRADLRAELKVQNWTWIDDPSNEDFSFDRVKMRGLLAQAEEAGFSIDGLLQSASNMARAKLALDPIAQDFMELHVRTLPLEVEDQIDPNAFAALPPFIATKVLGQLCQKFGDSNYLPRRDGIDRLYDQIINTNEGGMAIGRTDFHWSQNRIRVCAEFASLPDASNLTWHRWTSQNNSTLTMGAAGDHIQGLTFWRDHGLSQRAAKTLPALFDGDKLAFVHGDESAGEYTKFGLRLIET